MSKLDPISPHHISFFFGRCQVRLDGQDLLVSVPLPAQCSAGSCAADAAGVRWSAPFAAGPGEVLVDCEPGERLRRDRTEYPREPAYPSAATFRFRGRISYGRVPSTQGWMLLVEGPVRSLGAPLAAQAGADAVLVQPAPLEGDAVKLHQGPINGPHMPFP